MAAVDRHSDDGITARGGMLPQPTRPERFVLPAKSEDPVAQLFAWAQRTRARSRQLHREANELRKM